MIRLLAALALVVSAAFAQVPVVVPTLEPTLESTLEPSEEAAAAANHLQKAAAAVVIFLVLIEVAPKVVDSGRQEGNLDGSAATILFV